MEIKGLRLVAPLTTKYTFIYAHMISPFTGGHKGPHHPSPPPPPLRVSLSRVATRANTFQRRNACALRPSIYLEELISITSKSREIRLRTHDALTGWTNILPPDFGKSGICANLVSRFSRCVNVLRQLRSFAERIVL